MLALVPEEIERYAASHTEEESSVLREITKETYARTEIPQMLVGPLEGVFLRLLVRMTQARLVVEVGTFTGYSALAMAEGLPEDGQLITLDVSEEWTAIAKKYWNRSPHGKKIELKLGPALESLKAIEGPIDLVFIDADKENYVNYWEACLPKVRKGGVIAVDNVLWSGRVLKPQDETDHAICALNEHAKKDRRVEAVMLTLRDGILIAIKK